MRVISLCKRAVVLWWWWWWWCWWCFFFLLVRIPFVIRQIYFYGLLHITFYILLYPLVAEKKNIGNCSALFCVRKKSLNPNLLVTLSYNPNPSVLQAVSSFFFFRRLDLLMTIWTCMLQMVSGEGVPCGWGVECGCGGGGGGGWSGVYNYIMLSTVVRAWKVLRMILLHLYAPLFI